MLYRPFLSFINHKTLGVAVWLQEIGNRCSCSQQKALLPLRLLKVWSDELSKYDEPLGYVMRGIEFDGGMLIAEFTHGLLAY